MQPIPSKIVDKLAKQRKHEHKLCPISAQSTKQYGLPK